MPIRLDEEHGGKVLAVTRAAVRYFDHARAAEARIWLDEA
jgi:hypothetical protein